MAACEETQEIGEGKLFSPGNLRATFDNTNYAKVYMELSYT
jgi:sedoheptulose-bisphosphatase